jgi:hypothetical protein
MYHLFSKIKKEKWGTWKVKGYINETKDSYNYDMLVEKQDIFTLFTSNPGKTPSGPQDESLLKGSGGNLSLFGRSWGPVVTWIQRNSSVFSVVLGHFDSTNLNTLQGVWRQIFEQKHSWSGYFVAKKKSERTNSLEDDPLSDEGSPMDYDVVSNHTHKEEMDENQEIAAVNSLYEMKIPKFFQQRDTQAYTKAYPIEGNWELIICGPQGFQQCYNLNVCLNLHKVTAKVSKKNSLSSIMANLCFDSSSSSSSSSSSAASASASASAPSLSSLNTADNPPSSSTISLPVLPEEIVKRSKENYVAVGVIFESMMSLAFLKRKPVKLSDLLNKNPEPQEEEEEEMVKGLFFTEEFFMIVEFTDYSCSSFHGYDGLLNGFSYYGYKLY